MEKTYSLFDVGAEVIASKFNSDPAKVKKILLMFDLDPREAYRKMSRVLVMAVVPRSKLIH
ncbi:hypothetical protein KAT51_04805 [bacterium]|nr:hypothetical protein [bacterium]